MDCLATEYETLVGLDNTYTMNIENKHFPASFRVIGVGHGIENVINEINSFGFEGVWAEVVKYPFDCTPQDEDKLAIICFNLDCVDYLSIHLYFDPDRSIPLAMNDMASLSELMSALQETINVIWSVNKDDKLNGDEIRLSVILAGKEVWKCQTT